MSEDEKKRGSLENPTSKRKTKPKSLKPGLRLWAACGRCAVMGAKCSFSPSSRSVRETRCRRKQFNVSIKVNITESKPNVPLQQSVETSSCFGAGPWLQISRCLNSLLPFFIISLLISYFYIPKSYFNSASCPPPDVETPDAGVMPAHAAAAPVSGCREAGFPCRPAVRAGAFPGAGTALWFLSVCPTLHGGISNKCSRETTSPALLARIRDGNTIGIPPAMSRRAPSCPRVEAGVGKVRQRGKKNQCPEKDVRTIKQTHGVCPAPRR